MDTTFNETAATPNTGPGDLPDAAVARAELTRRLKQLLRAGDPGPELGAASFDTQDSPAGAVGGSEAADQEPGGATKCAYCHTGFESGEPHQMIDGKLYHSHLCAKFATPIASTA